MKNTLTLNVGLNRNTGGTVSAADVRREIARHARIVKSAIHQSDTEATLVCQIDAPSHKSPCRRLCKQFAQDCVAVVKNGRGELVGPKAAQWSPFNPAYFLQLDGKRMG